MISRFRLLKSEKLDWGRGHMSLQTNSDNGANATKTSVTFRSACVETMGNGRCSWVRVERKTLAAQYRLLGRFGRAPVEDP